MGRSRPTCVDGSIFLLSNTARVPAPALLWHQHCCALSPEDSQTCLTRPQWATASRGALASPARAPAPSLDVWGLASKVGRVPAAPRASSRTECLPVSQRGGGRKAVRYLLTSPASHGVQGLLGPTSKVKLDVRRRGPGDQQDQQTGSPGLGLLDRLSGGPHGPALPGPPHPFL